MSIITTSIKRRYIGVSEKDNDIYLFFTSSQKEKTVFSLAHSTDGITFAEFKKNPVIIKETGEYEDPKKCSNFRVSAR